MGDKVAMKILDYEGNWVGLAYYEHEYIVDYFSSPDSWTIGFDIVYRLNFMLDHVQEKDERVRDSFRKAFKEAFGLSDEHYQIQDWFGGGVFWRVYWDRQAFDLRLLKKFEYSLNECAERTKTRVILYGMTIIPRSAQEIAKLVKSNQEFSKNVEGLRDTG